VRLFFIRHIPSGLYLPEPPGPKLRGGSLAEPGPFENARVFRSRWAAQVALTSWLKGVHVYNLDTETIHINTRLERVASDMEIIEKELTE
jgi:hypothetical protein